MHNIKGWGDPKVIPDELDAWYYMHLYSIRENQELDNFIPNRVLFKELLQNISDVWRKHLNKISL